MATFNVRDLIKAGFHFGHRTSRWNPAMKPYIFKRRNLIHIIDLRASLRGLITARKLARVIAAQREYVLFVGTKKQASDLTESQARRCNMPFVAERWPGGLLTNYTTVRRRLDRLVELEELEETGKIDLYSKQMVSSLRREKRKILRNLGGVRTMDRLPGLLVIVDPAREYIAVREARKLGIPIIALTDTDGNPDDIDVVVPGNDDSIAAIEIYLSATSEAILPQVGAGAEAAAAEPVESAEAAEPEGETAQAEPEGVEPAGDASDDALSGNAAAEAAVQNAESAAEAEEQSE